MRLRILATATLLTPLCLAATVRAESPAHIRYLQSFQSTATQPILIAESTWKEWASPKGSFAVLMPGSPVEETEKDKDGSVDYYLKYESEKDIFYVMYTDIPSVAQASAEEVKQILDRLPGEFVKGAEAKLLSQKSLSLTGYPAREFEFTFSNGIPGKGRVYLVNQRLYVTIAATPQQENAQKFLTSFRLTTKG